MKEMEGVFRLQEELQSMKNTGVNAALPIKEQNGIQRHLDLIKARSAIARMEVIAEKRQHDEELKKKIKMKIFLYEAGSRHSTFLEEGFVLMNQDGSDGLSNFDPFVRSELMLLWQLFFSVVGKFGFQLPVIFPQTDVPDNTPAVRVQLSSRATSLTLGRPISRSTNFVIGHSRFIMKLSWRDVAKGEIHIYPITTFYPEFVNALGNFCFKSPKVFSNGVEKVCWLYNLLHFRLFYLFLFLSTGRPWSVCHV